MLYAIVWTFWNLFGNDVFGNQQNFAESLCIISYSLDIWLQWIEILGK
jgi:hypothetical protein